MTNMIQVCSNVHRARVCIMNAPRMSFPRNFIGKEFKFKNNLQGDFGHFRENNQSLLSKVAKIALRDCF